ncbi:MAG: Gfo/Idh/MocA family oxidoreductase, partial [Planctomycetota bacterium]|nr:Gfo/Idh/MocA family oxidoreductase [Planctomycetota bacterium]
FAPLAVELKEHFTGCGPLNVQYRCNAGSLPADHWISDPSEGGRIIGEACHFLDFFTFLTGAEPVTVFAAAPSVESIDDAVITVTYADGSVCQLVYSSTGPSSYSKERVEVFAGGMAGVLTDFRTLEIHSDSERFKPRKSMQADKGHSRELAAFVDAIQCGEQSPISTESLFDTTLVSFAVLESIQQGMPISIAQMRESVVSSSGDD